MTEFVLFAIPLAAVAAALLAWPLWRRAPGGPTRAEFDLAVFRDQLAEIDRDKERGLLDSRQAEAARLEVERRILAVAGEVERAARPSPKGRWVVLAVASGAPAAAAVAYLFLGSAGTPDLPLAARPDTRQAGAGITAEARLREQVPDLDAAVARLEERLAREPEDQRGWLMLGRTYMVMEKYAEAAAAFARAQTLSRERDFAIALEEVEAMIMASNSAVPPLALKILAEVLEHDPREPRARYYVGVAKAQAGDLRGAAQDWTDLIALSPADADWVPTVREQIEAVAKELGVKPDSFVPSAAAQALLRGAPAPTAAAPRHQESVDRPPTGGTALPAGQEEMIRGMVERLAQRLKENPDDAESWRMLARSYEVLGQMDKAKEARAKADALAGKH
ncbi:MAG: c-type cytochrome biogenesis protein CcmI [Rhodospirillales bacterium]|nr:c-type cytochrome biogenesis protein CcmI [Rhodospirillales bacterium]